MQKTEMTTVYHVGELTSEVCGYIEQYSHKKFLTADVITTSVNITHMNEKHDNSYVKYGHLAPKCIRCPSYIFVAKRGCYTLVRELVFDKGDEKYLLIILQPKKETDPDDYANKMTTLACSQKARNERIVNFANLSEKQAEICRKLNFQNLIVADFEFFAFEKFAELGTRHDHAIRYRARDIG